MDASRFTNDKYTVGWISALKDELKVAMDLWDEGGEHGLPQFTPQGDDNSYLLGEIHGHNVAMACLSGDLAGVGPAAAVAKDMLRTFENIRIILLVGIGGGVPTEEHDVRLGDVVVSYPVTFPDGGYHGVVQYDYGKLKTGGEIDRKDWFSAPEKKLLSAVDMLEMLRTRRKNPINKMPEILEALGEEFAYPGNDRLYKKEFTHSSTSEICNLESCPAKNLDLSRAPRQFPHVPEIHKGTIASGSMVIKNCEERDKINRRYKNSVLCVEMEAAGLMHSHPGLVIRGISDYADSHKNDDWRRRAIAVACAYAKEILRVVRPETVNALPPLQKTLEAVQQTMNEMADDVRDLKQKAKDAEQLTEREKILEWLTPTGYSDQQSSYFGRCEPETGQWLLRAIEYQDWLKDKKQTLFCPGIPGAGKTFLTSIIVEDIRDRIRNGKIPPGHAQEQSTEDASIRDGITEEQSTREIHSIGIAYLYCNYKEHLVQRAEDLLKTLQMQLVRGLSSMPENVRNFYKKHKLDRTQPSFNEISTVLRSVAAMYSRVFIIVDALDECRPGDLDKLLPEIFNLQSKCEANIFATSRFIPKIVERFIPENTEGLKPKTPKRDKQCKQVKIRANDNDVRRFLDGNMPTLPDFEERSPEEQEKLKVELQEEIKARILELVDGMFLLAKLHLDSLRDKDNPNAVRAALKKLTTGTEAYNDSYAETMKRIGELGKRVLSWITCAERQLTTKELQQGLAVELGKCELDQDSLTGVGRIVSVCAGLVTVDREGGIDEKIGIVRLVHYTAQQYLERTQTCWFPDAQSDIANACITCLSFNVFDIGSCSTDREYEERQQEYPFHGYAARSWGQHARKASIEAGPWIPKFLESESKLAAASQALLVSRTHRSSRDYSQSMPGQIKGVHLAAYFGLEKFMASLFEKGHGLDVKDTDSRTPLSWAAEKGRDEVVRHLLEKHGVEPDFKDKYGQTPLSWAAENGHVAAVKLLLERGDVDPNSKDSDGRTPLSWAAQMGHTSVVGLLLENDAVDPNYRDEGSRPPLSWAVEYGHEGVVTLLLKKGVEVQYPYRHISMTGKSTEGRMFFFNFDTEEKTPLFRAMEKGNETIADMLLEKDGGQTLLWAAQTGNKVAANLLLAKRVEPDPKDNLSRTPLLWATLRGHEEVVELLLKNNANPNSKDEYGWTPLAMAATAGHVAVVKLLLQNGAKPESEDYYHRILQGSAREGHEATVKLLLEKGTDLGFMDKSGKLLLLSVEKGLNTVVKWLLENGVELESEDASGVTLLLLAAREGHEVIVELLLENGAGMESKGIYGQMLLWAAANRNEAVVNLLLKKGAERGSVDHSGLELLSLATKDGYEEAIKQLLECDAELERSGSYSQTLLLLAAESGYEAVVSLALGKGVELESKDIAGRTSLCLAAKNGHKAVARLLLEKGANPGAKSQYNQTPLFFAAMNGHEELARLLLEKSTAELESIDGNCWTPLLSAAEGGHEAVVQLLLANGAGVGHKGACGRTALYLAIQHRHEGVVRLLLKNGADPESKDRYGQTLRSLATKNGLEAW